MAKWGGEGGGGGRSFYEEKWLLDMGGVPSKYKRNTTWFVFLLRMHKTNPDSHCKIGPKTIFLHSNKPQVETAWRYLYCLSTCMSA
jgi:hypothetical protein